MKVYGVSSGAAFLIVNWWARCVSCRHVLAALRPEENPGPYRIGGWVDPRGCLDYFGEDKYLPVPVFELRTVHPVAWRVPTTLNSRV